MNEIIILKSSVKLSEEVQMQDPTFMRPPGNYEALVSQNVWCSTTADQPELDDSTDVGRVGSIAGVGDGR
jgi:hypothetical protein